LGSPGMAVSYTPSAVVCRSTADASFASSFVATPGPRCRPAWPLASIPAMRAGGHERSRRRGRDDRAPGPRAPGLQSLRRAALLLLFIGLHNAWGVIRYHVFEKRREQRDEERRQ